MNTRSKFLAVVATGFLTSCIGRVNAPIIDNSYDARTSTKPYRYEGETFDDCDILTPEQRANSGGCVDYEQINKVDGKQ